MGFSMFSTFILLPNFVQIPAGLPEEIAADLDYGFGATPVEVGLFFVPSSIAMIVAGPLAGVLGQRVGRIIPLRIGLASLVLAMTMLATFHDQSWTIYVVDIGVDGRREHERGEPDPQRDDPAGRCPSTPASGPATIIAIEDGTKNRPTSTGDAPNRVSERRSPRAGRRGSGRSSAAG